jgi:hypothetical protein
LKINDNKNSYEELSASISASILGSTFPPLTTATALR